MGMYDELEMICWCPFCGAKLDEVYVKKDGGILQLPNYLQTKDLESQLDKYVIKLPTVWARGDHIAAEFHTSCAKCKCWISLNISRENLEKKEEDGGI